MNRRRQGAGRRGADLVVEILRAAGVERIFSVSGNQIMPVYDASLDVGIDIVHARHEGAAVFMADAWAQLTGGLGVALVTAAPGAMNALGALYSARCSESPVLLLTGDSPVGQDGSGAFQELDQVAVTKTLAKVSRRPHDVSGLLRDMPDAIRTALSGRPGPVHVALASDIVDSDAAGLRAPARDALMPVPSLPEEELVGFVAARVAGAARPVVVCGPALAETRTGALLESLRDALDAPVICMESPRGVRDPALGDLAAVFGNSDLVVSLGRAVDFALDFGRVTTEHCRWIVLEPDEAGRERASKNLGPRMERCIAADALAFARALAAAGPAPTRRAAWRAEVSGRIAWRGEAPARKGMQGGAITSAELCAAVQRLVGAHEKTIVVSDGGEFGQWAQACVSGSRRVINGASGAIGGGVPYGLAAALATPDATVVVLTGDGSVGFHLAEFETAARVGARFVVIVGNDRRWNAEHQIQLRDYGPSRLVGCGLSEARYDLAVVAMGGHGDYVTCTGELVPALERAFAAGRVACVNVAIEGLPAPSGPARQDAAVAVVGPALQR